MFLIQYRAIYVDREVEKQRGNELQFCMEIKRQDHWYMNIKRHLYYVGDVELQEWYLLFQYSIHLNIYKDIVSYHRVIHILSKLVLMMKLYLFGPSQ